MNTQTNKQTDLLVDVPDLFDEVSVQLIGQLVVEDHEAAESHQLAPLACLVGLPNAGLEEGEDGTQTEGELLEQYGVLGHGKLPLDVEDLVDAGLQGGGEEIVRDHLAVCLYML